MAKEVHIGAASRREVAGLMNNRIKSWARSISHIDLIPDFIPVLGFMDEVVLLPIAIAGVLKLVPSEVIAECRDAAAVAAEQPVSRIAAGIIMVVWAAAIGLLGFLSYRLSYNWL